MTTTRTLLSIAIIATLPFGAMAENISGAMYTAPSAADTNHPAPTTDANPSYGRVNIDTTDQEHIATTAYVKGAYNSAIAAVNTVALSKVDNNNFDNTITGLYNHIDNDIRGDLESQINDKVSFEDYDTQMVNVYGAIGEVADTIETKRITIYTTWNDDSANATAQVALSSAQ